MENHGLKAVLGLNRTQDASIALVKGDEIVCAVQKERLSRKKHHWGGLDDVRSLYASRLGCLSEPVDLVVECYSSDPQMKKLDEYRAELSEVIRFRGEPRFEIISHHLAHLYSVFHTSGFESAAVMIIDSLGSPISGTTEEWPEKASMKGEAFEVASFYVADQNSVRCIKKQAWDYYNEPAVGLGNFYYHLTRTMFKGAGSEGKVMGLAPYASHEELPMPPLDVRDGSVFIPKEWVELFAQKERFGHFLLGTGTFEECARLAAAGQHAFENAIVEVAKWLKRETGERNLCFAGGTALNCVANTLIRRHSGFEDVFIPPAPHDGGTALGCAIYGLKEILGEQPQVRWKADYLGPVPEENGFHHLIAEDPELVCEKPESFERELARRIAGGEIVGLFQGRSEFGPRALGHRSIIADSRRSTMKDWINSTIKGREMYRPLAPIVLSEDAEHYFEISHPSPHMLYTVDTHPEKVKEIPSVVHVDGSARVQTVAEDDDPFIRNLLKEFRNLTGVGVLLNTSFNGKNDPIVEDIRDALDCYKKFPMHVLAFPPYLVTKKTRPPVPEM